MSARGLTFVEKSDSRRDLFECSCGKRKVISRSHVARGITKSCGCLRKDVVSKAFMTHGHTVGGTTRVYRIWQAMLNRCRNKNVPSYKRYGEAGITVCKRWHKFENFVADIGDCPSSKHSINRVNNKLGYSKTNCKWATSTEQARNRKNTIMVRHNGKTLPLSSLAEEVGIRRQLLWDRICVRGWTVERAVSQPKWGSRS